MSQAPTPIPGISRKQQYAALAQGAADLENNNVDVKTAAKTLNAIKRSSKQSGAMQIPLQIREELLSRYGFQFNTTHACFAKAMSPKKDCLLLVFKGEGDNLAARLEPHAYEWALTSLMSKLDESTEEMSSLVCAAKCVIKARIKPTPKQTEVAAVEAKQIAADMREWLATADHGIETWGEVPVL